MVELKNINDKEKLIDDNVVLGTFPELHNSKIVFRGKGNILFCEEGVKIENSNITFNKNNSLVYLGKSSCAYKLNAFINEKCVLAFGRNNYINETIQIVLSEHKHFFVGSDCMFSSDIVIRNADAHLIYDVETLKRINMTKSIFIGDHVWIGKGAYISKGSKVSSGSIIGANSLLSNKSVEHNTTYGGNPARKVKEGIFWNGCCVHPWDDTTTENSTDYEKFINTYLKNESVDRWIFDVEELNMIRWDDIDNKFSSNDTDSKVLFLKGLYNTKNKNRFSND